MLGTVKDVFVGGAMRLMSSPQVTKVVNDPRVMSAAMKALSLGGTVKTEIWGRRRLAYEIDKQVEGIYAIVDIQATPAAVAELDRQLNLNESVLRTKLMRPEVH